MSDDTRLVWIRERLLSTFGEKDTVLFYDLVERDDGCARVILRDFLDLDLTHCPKSQKRIIYFQKTYYDKIIEEEIVVAEPIIYIEKAREATPPVIVIKKKTKKKGGSKKKKVSDFDEAEDDELEGDDDPEERKEVNGHEELEEQDDDGKTPKVLKKKKVAEKQKKDKDNGKVSPRTAVETPPPPTDTEEPQFALVPKIVQRVVQAPEIHVFQGFPSEDATDVFIVYFIRKSLGPVPSFDSYAEARSGLPNHVLFGGLKGRYLSNFQLILSAVISPMLKNQFREPETALTRFNSHFSDSELDLCANIKIDRNVFTKFAPPSIYRRASLAKIGKRAMGNFSAAKDDLLSDLSKIENSVDEVIDYLDKNITLDMPQFDVSSIPEDEHDEALRSILETVKIWEIEIENLLSEYKSSISAANDPLAEIDYWRNKYSSAISLMQQFQKTPVTKITDFLTKSNSSFTSNLCCKLQALQNVATQAQENVEALQNISRHLRIVTLSNSFKPVDDSLPELIEGLRMIWILSNYYNTDNAMVDLMQKISCVLCNKVATNLKSEQIFKEPLPEIISKTRDAYTMLVNWRKLYLKKRLEIEHSSSSARWEFEQRKLFAETEYIASVCKDLNNIALVVQQFLTVFGPTFKFVVRDPTQIDTIIKRVENLVLGIELTDFDIYKPSCRDNWQAVVESFYKDVKCMEKQMKYFIDQAFMMLRSSEDALEMLLKLKNEDTRPKIKSLLMEKFDVLLNELMKEIVATENEFNRGKKNPPILRYQPPASGAIFWERLLFLKMKKPILHFKQIKECSESPIKSDAFTEYVSLGKQMKEFETSKFDQWRKQAEPICATILQIPLLLIAEICETIPMNVNKKITEIEFADENLLSTTHMLQDCILSDYNLRFVVNFSENVFDIIAEADIMEYLGYEIPWTVRNIALQKTRLYFDLTSVKNMIQEYDEILALLTPEQLKFAADFLLIVQKHILPGYARLSWHSLSIQEYVNNCRQSLKQLKTVINHVRRIEGQIRNKIDKFKNFQLFPIINDCDKNNLMNCLEYFASVQLMQANAFVAMLNIYFGIGPILMKLESLIYHTCTGRSPEMALIYESWSKSISETLVDIVIDNLEKFNQSLVSNNVIFQVSVALKEVDVVLDPLPEELYNCVVKSAADCIAKLKSFPSWQEKSCLPDVYNSHFFHTVQRKSSIVMEKIQKTGLNLASDCYRKLSGWNKYSKLWKQDIAAKCDVFSSTKPCLSDYDEKFTFYTTTEQNVSELPTCENIRAIRMNFNPIISAIINSCVTWKQTLGDRLAETTSVAMHEFQDLISDLYTKLDEPIKSLADYKRVSHTIEVIHKSTVQSEIKNEQYEEVYHIIKLHKIRTNPIDEQMSRSVKKQWQDLYVSSLYKSRDLQPTKEKFASITVREISEFQTLLKEFIICYKDSGPASIADNLESGLQIMKKFKSNFIEFEAKRDELLIAEVLFALPTTDYSEFMKIEQHYKALEDIFDVYENLQVARDRFSIELWCSVDIKDMAKQTEKLLKQLRNLDNTQTANPVYVGTEKCLKELKLDVALFNQLKNKSIIERHWRIVMEKTGVNFDLSPDKVTISDLFNMKLHEIPGIVEELVASAEKEMEIDTKIKQILTEWHEIEFKTDVHSLGCVTRGFILCEVDGIKIQLEGHAISLEIMSASKFIKPFLIQVERMEQSLTLYLDIIDQLCIVQKQWLQLEPAFLIDKSLISMPNASKEFHEVDACLRNIMDETFKNPKVIDCCKVINRLEQLKSLRFILNRCQESLNEYIYRKRVAFPRFFFISDEEILSMESSSTPITKTLVKMFDNIESLIVTDNNMQNMTYVLGMESREQEVLTFENNVRIEHKIEKWMTAVVNEMKNSVKFNIKKCIFEYGTIAQSRVEWLRQYCCTICIAACQVWWCAEVEESFLKLSFGKQNAMKIHLTQLNNQVDELVLYLKGCITKTNRKKFVSCIIFEIQNRDIVETLIKNGVSGQKSFLWESQLKFYWCKDSDDLIVEQCSNQIEYGYEYFGVNSFLVITPINQKIHLTITQALSKYVGCYLIGDTGSGKTEITKNLAKILGLLCLVTNSYSDFDLTKICKILSVACQCGIWQIFENFNNILPAVLSVVSSQLKSIRNALRLNVRQFILADKEIALDRKVGIFLTLTSQYYQRSGLSECIRAQFRPIACSNPKLKDIFTVLLLSEGFTQAKALASKISHIQRQSTNLLSEQHYYNFSIRSFLPIITQAGNVLRSTPDTDEHLIIAQLLTNLILPQLLTNDIPIFLGLAKDIFPGFEYKNIRPDLLQNYIQAAIKDLNLQIIPGQAEKVQELYEIMTTRHAVILIGSSGTGKTVILKLLHVAEQLQGVENEIYFCNLKAFTIDQLYGFFDESVHSWRQGLLSLLFRKIANNNRIIFDGDLDDEWIEGLHTAMDNNKLVTFPNDERLQLQERTRIVFETADLKNASPVTVSRMGVLFVHDSERNIYYAYWTTWRQSQNDTTADLLDKLYNKYYEPLLQFVFNGHDGDMKGTPLKQTVRRNTMDITQQLCAVLEATLPKKSVYCTDQEEDELVNEVFECIFIQALYLSFGATILIDDRKKFDQFVKKLSALPLQDDSMLNKAKLPYLPNTESTIFDYFVSLTEKSWVAWKWTIPSYCKANTINTMFVPTIDTMRTSWILELFQTVNRPIALIGETGTSKTAIINNFLTKLSNDFNKKITLTFCSTTTAESVRKNIESGVKKRTKHLYGPPIGTKLLIFIDDMNMPKPDKSGTQQPVAFLKFLFENSGYYNSSCHFIKIADYSIVAAMSEYGSKFIDSRFLSKLSVFHTPMTDNDTIVFIIKTILGGHLLNFCADIQNIISNVSNATVALFNDIKSQFPALPGKYLFSFTMRDLLQVCKGLCQAEPLIIATPEAFVRVWRNEVTRVFSDRMSNQDDLKRFADIVAEKAHQILPDHVASILRDPLLFGDFRNACRVGADRLYEDLLDYDAVYFLFKEILEESQDVLNLKMVLFDHVIEHLTRIHRVLRLSYGHVMLVGSNGSGKQTMAKLACLAAGLNINEFKKTSDLSLEIFLKSLFKKSGLMDKKIAWVFSDKMSNENHFLEILNSILATGVISSIYTTQEIEEIISFLRIDKSFKGNHISCEQLWDFFCTRCKNNLHIIICLSPVGQKLKKCCMNFPSLFKYTTVDWYKAWPEEALISVANTFLAENPEVSEEHRSNVVRHIVYMHNSLDRQSHEYFLNSQNLFLITPKQYLTFVELYLDLLKRKKDNVMICKRHLTETLQNIIILRSQITDAYAKLSVQKITVDNKIANCDSLQNKINALESDISSKKMATVKKKKEIEEQEKIIQLENTEAEEILDEAIPVLATSKAALDDIDAKELVELTSYETPSQVVQTVCECVLYLMGVKEVSWDVVQETMADPFFITKLRTLDCEQISLTQQRLCRNHGKNLPTDLSASSRTAHGLMVFVNAVLGYCSVFREVNPKRTRIEQLKEDNKEFQTQVLRWQLQVIEQDERLEALKVNFEEAFKEKEKWQTATNAMTMKVEAADKLLQSLNQHEQKWSKNLEMFNQDSDKIIGDSLICAAFLTYLGPFPLEFRQNMLHENWLKELSTNLPVSSNFEIEKKLCDEVHACSWLACGLPDDIFSMQNAILVTQSIRTPLLIDPNNDFINWIRQNNNIMQHISFQDPLFVKKLEMAAFKESLLILEFKNIDLIQEMLDNFIEQNCSDITVTLMNTTIKLSRGSKIIFVINESNPYINTSLLTKTTVINCMDTRIGLESQFLHHIVRYENIECEKSRVEVMQEKYRNSLERKNIDEALMKELSVSEDNILDNEERVAYIQAKVTAGIREAAMYENINESSKKLQETQEHYRKTAKRAAILYLVMADMAAVSSMYQFSKTEFSKLLTFCLLNAPASESLVARQSGIMKMLTWKTYEYGCCGIFNKDKLLLSFQIAIKLHQEKMLVTQSEINCLVSNFNGQTVRSPVSWLSNNIWARVIGLAENLPDTFGNIIETLKNEGECLTWFNSEAPELTTMPGINCELSYFQKLIILNCLRPDRFVHGIKSYISAVLGTDFATTPKQNIAEIMETTSPKTPCIVMYNSSSCADTLIAEVREIIAADNNRFKMITFGQGQESKIRAIFESACTIGYILLFKNVHLQLSFLQNLKADIEKRQNIHPDFRLFLTTKNSNNFPIDLLKMSIKVASDEPDNLQQNVQSNLKKIEADLLSPSSHPKSKPLIYVLAFFHSVITERKAYGPHGWKIAYNFTESDFLNSQEILETYLKKCTEDTIPWETLKYLIGKIVYGAHILDKFDMRVLETYLNEYIGEFLFDKFQPFHFFSDCENVFNLPSGNCWSDFVEHVQNLDSKKNSLQLGLSRNAEIGYYLNWGNHLSSRIYKMQPSIKNLSSTTNPENTCSVILSKLPDKFDLEKIRKTFQMGLKPTAVFLLQELERFNVLITKMGESLDLLKRAMAGQETMDDELEDLQNCLMLGQLPQSWRKLAPDTQKTLSSWLIHFEKRSKQYREWVQSGEPIVMWISGLHAPEAYLAALVQTTCRDQGWSIQKTVTHTEVSEFHQVDQVEQRLPAGTYVEGMYLDGAVWDSQNMCLKEPHPRIIHGKLPLLKIIPEERRKLKNMKTLKTPVYVTSKRNSTCVFEADLAIEDDASFWVLRGVCLLLNDD